MKRCDNLSTVGIIAEFNPLHTGHKFLLESAQKKGTVVCVISSNFVQRGDTALIEKRKRTEAALKCGADVVLELPVYWSMSTAQNFALGGISILKDFGCDTLMFGSENGNISELEKAVNIFSSEKFAKILKDELNKGITFAQARENAALKCGAEEGLISGANNNLGIEYILASKVIGASMNFETVKRIGAGHDSTDISDGYTSASNLRNIIKTGNFQQAAEFIPKPALNFTNSDISDISRLENAILTLLRKMKKEDFSLLPDLSEGLENKIFSASRVAVSLEELYNEVKVKRYTHARIRRIILSAFLGLDNSFFMKKPPYIRVLGFSKNGERLLKEKSKLSPIPVITKAKDILKLSETENKLFKAECRATDLYALSLKKPLPCGLEYTSKIIKTE